MKRYLYFLMLGTMLISCFNSSVFAKKIPEIKKDNQGVYTLLLKGKPMLMLSGEMGNSSASVADELKISFPKLEKMHLNTVLVPVYWDLMEPTEGNYDFTLVDAMIQQARTNHLHIVILWFGTWKNSMSCYVPEWMKKDYKRFPRTLDKTAKPSEIVSSFSSAALQADCKSFKALMSHIAKIDEAENTVLMIQVENEIGQLPEARDYSAEAQKAFNSNVPEKLIRYLVDHESALYPSLKEAWATNGYKKSGNWESVFGKGLATDEIFTAWYFASYANQVAQSGKSVYPLPMYVNCALNRPNVVPGKYPSGGPLPHLIDIWKAAAPAIDMLSPDVYHGDYRQWLTMYDRSDNPVFLPEIKRDTTNAAQVFYTIGKHKSLGYSPFAIEQASVPEMESLRKSYETLDDVSELLLANRSKSTGVYADKQHQTDTLFMGDYQIVVGHVCILPWNDGAKAETWTPAACVVIQTAPDEFWIAGTSVVCTFRNVKDKTLTTGILSADKATRLPEGWKYKRLSGDETHQGRHMRMGSGEWEIQRIRLYNYR